METILPLLQSWLDQLASLLPSIPKDYALAAALVPAVLAIAAGRFLVLVGVALLSATAFALLLDPSLAAATLAVGAYVGSLIVALVGIQRRRRDAAIKADLAELRSELTRLAEAEQRRFLIGLKSGNKTVDEHGTE